MKTSTMLPKRKVKKTVKYYLDLRRVNRWSTFIDCNRSRKRGHNNNNKNREEVEIEIERDSPSSVPDSDQRRRG